MKKTIVFSPALLVCAMLVNSNCSNAPKTETTAIDTTKKSDTSAIVVQDTATKTSLSQTKFTPPPPPRVVDIPTIREMELDEETPPIYETNINPNYQTNEDLTTGEGPVPEMESKIFTVVDQMPEMYMFKEFLTENITYPEGAKDIGYQGVVTIGYVVDDYGRVQNVKVTKTSGNNELDMEAVRVIRKTSGRWKPGKINGKAVKTQMTVPITFKLEE
ncbi:MAG: energy transducer TonB [Chitinophagaceae bacterium]